MGGVLQMRTSTLFDAKNLAIFEIYGVSASGAGGSEDIFQTRVEKG